MQKYVIALYIRLSLEDYKYDSMSIENQHLALNEFVSSMPESANAEVLEFIDNGYSGTNFERPKVQELIEMVRANKIDCIIVKDFSRFGRNSIETGYFIERVFPLFHTRFISINDDFDSDQHKGDTGGMDVAFKYLISEYYSRDMSIKTKSAKYAKMQRGEWSRTRKPLLWYSSFSNLPQPELEQQPLPGNSLSKVSRPPANTKQLMGSSTTMSHAPVDAGAVLRFSVSWRMNAISAPMSSDVVLLLKWAAHGAAGKAGTSGSLFPTIIRQSLTKNYLKRCRLCSAGSPCRPRKPGSTH